MKETKDITHQYELDGMIGEGTYSCVYQLRAQTSKDAFVVKIYKEIRLPITELFIMRNIRHDNLMSAENIIILDKPLDTDSENKSKIIYNMYYDFLNTIVPETEEGGRIGVVMKQGNVSNKIHNMKAKDAIQCIYQILCALGKLHELSLIHGDVKPDNILLFPNNRYVLSDFGLTQPAGSPYQHPELCQTIGYRAPELIYFTIPVMSFKSDIFALGAAILSLISGKVRLFEQDYDTPEKLICIIEDVMSNMRLQEGAQLYEPDYFMLRQVLYKMLEFDFNYRFDACDILKYYYYYDAVNPPYIYWLNFVITASLDELVFEKQVILRRYLDVTTPMCTSYDLEELMNINFDPMIYIAMLDMIRNYEDEQDVITIDSATRSDASLDMENTPRT